MVEKKEVRVFLDGIYLNVIDDLIGSYGTNRSEVVRTMVHDWVKGELGFDGLMKYKKKK
jgi:metal-responsive CopG/Arc/MetJ family transcriptional regulator